VPDRALRQAPSSFAPRSIGRGKTWDGERLPNPERISCRAGRRPGSERRDRSPRAVPP
jgi:hypothetical protein